MYKSLVIAMATLMVQSHVFAAKQKTINDQVKAKGNATSTSVRVDANRPEIANVLKGLRSNNVKTISSETIGKITNAEALMMLEGMLRAPVITEFTAKGGKLDEGRLLEVIDILAQIGTKIGNQSSSESKESDGKELIQSLLLLNLVPSQKLKELEMDSTAVARSKALLEQEVANAISPSFLAMSVHAKLVGEGRISMSYKEFLEALRNCLKSLKG